MPPPPTAELVAPLRADPGGAAILCDIDGTIAPISPLPGDAAVPERTSELLARLAERYAVVGCVSGRRAAEARAMVGVGSLHYVGNHGFELLGPGETEPRLDPAVVDDAGRVRELVASLDPAELDAIGIRLEDKGPIQSLHWRGAADEDAGEARARELAELARGRGLEPRWGRKVLELRPPAAIDKGTAIASLLAREGVRTALYGGDDVTDLDGFRALRAMRSDGALEHAVCVGVASDEEPEELRSLSDAVVAGTAGFAELLGALGDGG